MGYFRLKKKGTQVEASIDEDDKIKGKTLSLFIRTGKL